MVTNVRDPRSIVTPDAFQVDDALLGIPLASPGRRLAGILIDLVVIGTINAITSGLNVFIWGVVGLFLVTMAFRRPGNRMGQVTSRLFRGATGCLGFFILFIVALVGVATLTLPDDQPGVPGLQFSPETLAERFPDLSSLQGLGALGVFETATTEEEAAEAAQDFLQLMADLNTDRESMSDALLGVVQDAPFTDDPQAFADAQVRAFFGDTAVAGEGVEGAESPGGQEGSDAALPEDGGGEPTFTAGDRALLDSLETGDLALRLEDPATPDSARAYVRSLLLARLASDTLASLAQALDEERSDAERARRRAGSLAEELAETETGVVPLLRDIWDQVGSALGIWSIYFTVMLALFKGRTVGKRIVGTRVIQLDGEPIHWWAAFERAGGYAAGIATGLLGFAQVYWDNNRQCVHDKIARTVVVMDGAAPDRAAAGQAWATLPDRGA